MKKIKYLMIAFLMILLVGCNNEEEIGNYEVGIIESTSTDLKSLITYYDENLEIVGTKFLPYAELGTNFYNPEYHNDEIYIVPKGLQGYHNTKKVISINLKTGKELSYKVNKTNILCTAVNDKYIFTGSNGGGASYLTRIEYDGGEEKEIKFSGEYLSLVVASNDYAYAFISSLNDQNLYSKLNVYDSETLELKKSIDISEYGIDHTKYYMDHDKLYFTITRDKNDKATNKLGILDINNFTLSQVELLHDYPDDIQKISDNRLLISCSDVVRSDGTHVIIYNIDTGKQTSYDLKIPIMNIKTKGNKLYVLGRDFHIYVYDIENDMKLINSIEHKLTKGIYCSNLFVKE